MLSLKVLAANPSCKFPSMNHEQSGMMARGGKTKRKYFKYSSSHDTRIYFFLLTTSPHGCQLQPRVKGGAFFRVFCFVASGIHQQKVLKLESANKNKLDRWMHENLKFVASLEFFRHSRPLSALSNP